MGKGELTVHPLFQSLQSASNGMIGVSIYSGLLVSCHNDNNATEKTVFLESIGAGLGVCIKLPRTWVAISGEFRFGFTSLGGVCCS